MYGLLDLADWMPKVKRVSSLELKGVADVWAILSKFWTSKDDNGTLAETRRTQATEWMWSQAEAQIQYRLTRQVRII